MLGIEGMVRSSLGFRQGIFIPDGNHCFHFADSFFNHVEESASFHWECVIVIRFAHVKSLHTKWQIYRIIAYKMAYEIL